MPTQDYLSLHPHPVHYLSPFQLLVNPQSSTAMRLITLLTILTSGLLVQASNLDLSTKIKDDQCIQGCILPLSMVTFSDIPAKSSGTKAKCASRLYTASVLYCAEQYCSTKQFEAGWDFLKGQCGGVETQIQALTLLKALSPSDIRVVDCVKSAKQVFNGTIEPTEENVRLGLKTAVRTELPSCTVSSSSLLVHCR